MRRLIITPGTKFGKLSIVCEIEAAECGDRQFQCLCECGNTLPARLEKLRSGNRTSCGCGRRVHNDADSSEYSTWRMMIQRCSNPKAEGWENYGGRGITVCERWRNSYVEFLADMGRKPTPEHSIDRQDNSGNYEKSNCHWATKLEQDKNRRTTVQVMYNGELRYVMDVCEEVGISRRTYDYRVKQGWPECRLFDGPRGHC